jgi:ornithine cyclodeaminase/alanine dehydrogenase-like protein (mu-crystallin family)
MGVVLLSEAETGTPKAILDAGAVTALRTGAAAVLAAETLGMDDGPAAVVGAGVNGMATARTFLARGRDVLVWDLDGDRARALAAEIGGQAVSRAEALSTRVVATVTPAREPIFTEGSLRPGQHVSLMGADGPGKAEIAAKELARVHVFCDDWVQASHNGDLVHAVDAGVVGREDVTELGAVLAGEAIGRRSDADITVFDSTGLAIQDLAVALAAMERAGAVEGVVEIEL